jgi:carotenoid 1,2-hydratase
VAPLAHLQVDLDEPRVRFSGSGYHDANLGGEPIEDGFHSWTWSRSLGARACTVLYDVHRRDGGRASFGRLFREGAPAEDIAAPRLQRLRPTRWLLSRRTRTDAGARARIVRSLEDAPFYARTLIETTLAGERTLGMHESLDLDRFRNTWVQRMLPYKILHRRDG